MTDPIAAARLGQEVRRVGHGLHAAGDDDLGRAGPDEIMGEHGRLHAGAADLVDGRRACCVRQACPARGLAGRSLSLAGRQHAAHEDLVDLFGRKPGPVERGANDMAAKVWGAQSRETALEPSERAASGGNDYNWIMQCHQRLLYMMLDIYDDDHNVKSTNEEFGHALREGP